MIRGRERVSTQVRMWLNYPYPNFPSKENLVGYWAFNEGTGTTAFDNSGNSNHGTLVNMEEADWVDGVVGKCLDFDGVDEYVTIPNYYWAADTDFAISFWVNFTTYNSYQNVLSTCSNTGGDDGWWVEFGTSRGFTVVSNSSIFLEDNVQSLAGLSTGEWYHIVIARSGTGTNNLKGYIDTVLFGQGSSNVAIGDITNPLLIGRYAAGYNSLWLNGKADEVRIYSTALTASEIKALYDYPGGV